MTNIVEEIQLDYCDVMIKPKRSTLNSRSEPDIYRQYRFKYPNSFLYEQNTIYGNGLMVANMATTGTFAMAEVMAKNLMFTCLHKHYSFEDLKTYHPTRKDIELSQNRIIEKFRLRPNWYKWTKRDIPEYLKFNSFRKIQTISSDEIKRIATVAIEDGY